MRLPHKALLNASDHIPKIIPHSLPMILGKTGDFVVVQFDVFVRSFLCVNRLKMREIYF
jgi:hypothetical protein